MDCGQEVNWVRQMATPKEMVDAISAGYPVIGTDSQGRTMKLRLRPPKTSAGGWCLDIEGPDPQRPSRTAYTSVVLEKYMAQRLAVVLVEAL
jgi:hypothetical protein